MKKQDKDIYLTPADEEHKYTIIWLHGLGDTAQGFLDFFYSDDPIIPNKVFLDYLMLKMIMVIEY